MSGIDYTTASVPISLGSLGGGLNSTASALALADNEASDLKNIEFSVFGSVAKRNGYTRLNTSAANSGATCTGLTWVTLGGTSFLVGTFGDQIMKQDGLDGTWDDITGGVTITAGNDNLFTFTVLDDLMLATNNVDPVIKWTGTGNVAAGDVPTGLTDAQWTETWNNFAFYANTLVSGTRHSTRIYWSNLKDPTTWTATDFNDVGKNDGQAITGIRGIGDQFIIFKEHSIWKMLFTGDSDVPFVFQETPADVGCISGYSIQEVNNGLVFLAEDGLYFFDGVDAVKVSNRLNTTFSSFEDNRFDTAVSSYQHSKNRYWLSFTTSGASTHNRILIWDTANNAFSVYYGADAAADANQYEANAFTIVNTGGEERLYHGDYAGFSYRNDSGTNDHPGGTATDTAIAAFWKSKWFSFGDLINKKGVPHLTFYHQIADTTIKFSYSFDLEEADQYSQNKFIGTSSAKYGAALYDVDVYAASGGGIKRVDLTDRGYVVRVIFFNDTLDEIFQIDGVGMIPHLETVS
jgi:hypothetical protein